jgi:general secretion pathway protein G
MPYMTKYFPFSKFHLPFHLSIFQFVNLKMRWKMANDRLQIQRAFTLIELLVVISIIGILIGLSIFGLQGARASSRDARRKADLEQIRSALEIYKADCNNYPLALSSSLTGACPGPTVNTYMSSTPVDPVSAQAYSYTSPSGTTYTLCATLEQSSTPWCVSNP